MTEKTFGRYRITGELGRGAMGMVYRAVDPLIEREVAIKTLNPALPPEALEEVRERFLREAKSAGRLNHPNVVTIYDVGEQDGIAYIAMEFLEGRSLQQISKAGERLPHDRVADLIAQIADGLDHARGYSIVHRDVKPANVMVSPSGRAKLTDFGVAHLQSSTMTQTGMALGSPKYMSPEQVLGQPVDPRSDIFSLGVVLYELLVYRTPFESPNDSTVLTLMNRIARDPHQPVCDINPEIPVGFDVILSRALAKTPEGRYQTAGEMARDLRNYKDLRPSGEDVDSLADTQPLGQSVTTRTIPLNANPDSTLVRGPLEEKVREKLLADLDSFSSDFETQERERVAREAAELRKKKEALDEWAKAEARKREDFDRTREGPLGPDTTAIRRGALELLKRQAAERGPLEDKVRVRAETIDHIHKNLQTAFQYLAEFSTEMNGVTPTTGRPLEFLFLKSPSPVTLSDAFCDYRPAKVDGKDVIDHIQMRFRARYIKPTQIETVGGEVQRCGDFLKKHRVPFEFEETKKDDFGKSMAGTYVLNGPIRCEVVLRADYDNAAVHVELLNVGRIGSSRTTLAGKEFVHEIADDLARLVLGVDNAFEKRLKR
ncbi:MAG: serine/threonine protein kinase [Betaproteobacteria bacterium]|nr:serine/threonine protein kinase [Betaproteobacteria bacterium]